VWSALLGCPTDNRGWSVSFIISDWHWAAVADAEIGPLASFTSGIRETMPLSGRRLPSPGQNGQTEGQITTLKRVKRQMYGRGKLDLLQARLIKVA
jgi:hypothetical protein